MLRKNSDVHAMITEQIKDVEKCLVSFESFMRAVTTPETVPATLRSLLEGVKAAENAADVSLRAMIDSLSGGAYLPSTREDLIAIATSCDKIANKCETVAKVIVLHKFICPEEYAEQFNEIFDITKQQFELLEESVSMLFSKLNALQNDPAILDRIRALESMVDAIEDSLNDSIYESDMALAEKMQISNVVDFFCDISDIIEDIADKIQIMLIARKA